MGEAWTQTPAEGEPHPVPPHSCVKPARQGPYPGCQALVILGHRASYHPASPFRAWLTLYPFQISPLGSSSLCTKRGISSIYGGEALEGQPYTEIISQEERGSQVSVAGERPSAVAVLPSGWNGGLSDNHVPLSSPRY